MIDSFKSALLSLSVVMTAANPACADTLTVHNISDIPCAYWQKGTNGTWILLKDVIVGRTHMLAGSFKNSPMTQYLDKKCGG